MKEAWKLEWVSLVVTELGFKGGFKDMRWSGG
jgi:hypothetical protein